MVLNLLLLLPTAGGLPGGCGKLGAEPNSTPIADSLANGVTSGGQDGGGVVDTQGLVLMLPAEKEGVASVDGSLEGCAVVLAGGAEPSSTPIAGVFANGVTSGGQDGGSVFGAGTQSLGPRLSVGKKAARRKFRRQQRKAQALADSAPEDRPLTFCAYNIAGLGRKGSREDTRVNWLKSMHHDVIFIGELQRNHEHLGAEDKLFIPGGFVPKADKGAGVGLLLSDRAAQRVDGQGNDGPRVAWVRLKGSFTDLFCIVTYIPWHGCPNADAGETWAIIQKIIDTEVRESDCVIIGGDLNGRVGRNSGVSTVHGTNAANHTSKVSGRYTQV